MDWSISEEERLSLKGGSWWEMGWGEKGGKGAYVRTTIYIMDLVHWHIEGFRPEWYISTIYHAWDTPFWSGTLDTIMNCGYLSCQDHCKWYCYWKFLAVFSSVTLTPIATTFYSPHSTPLSPPFPKRSKQRLYVVYSWGIAFYCHCLFAPLNLCSLDTFQEREGEKEGYDLGSPIHNKDQQPAEGTKPSHMNKVSPARQRGSICDKKLAEANNV